MSSVLGDEVKAHPFCQDGKRERVDLIMTSGKVFVSRKKTKDESTSSTSLIPSLNG